MAEVRETTRRTGARAAGTTTAKPTPRVVEHHARDGHRRRGMTVTVPLTSLQIRIPPLPQVGIPDIAAAAEKIRAAMPPAPELAYFAGLGLLGLFSVIDWPVALAVGAGTVIAQQVDWKSLRRDASSVETPPGR